MKCLKHAVYFRKKLCVTALPLWMHFDLSMGKHVMIAESLNEGKLRCIMFLKTFCSLSVKMSKKWFALTFFFFLHCALKEQDFVVTFKIFVPFSVIFFVLAVKYTMTIRPVVSLYFCINKVSPKELLAENLACLSMVSSLSLIFDNRVGGCYHSVCP